jgi:opacity protein-like surface antigen
MWTKAVLLIGLTTLIITNVNAASVSIGPQLGYYQARDADDGSIMGGAVCRLKFSPVLGAEASINYRQEKYADGAVTVRSWPLMVTGLIYPFPVVYGAIGAGWYNVTFDYNQNELPLLTDETTQKFGWHFGCGVELPVASNFKLTGDIRYVFIDYDFQDVPGSENMKSDFFVATIGFLFDI